MKKSIIIILFLLMGSNNFAQNETCKNSLSGKVLDEHDSSPLDFATVRITELQKEAITDKKGFFKIENICNGTYTILVSHIGCKPIKIEVVVKGKTVKVFYPEHHAQLLEDVDVSAFRRTTQTTQTQNNVSEEKMNQSKGMLLGEVLKNIPGVSTLNTGNSVSKPIIHGMHSNRILVLNNEIRQEGQQWGVEHAPEVDPFIANKLTVIKGANSVRYGSDAVAGVVLIDTKPLRNSAGIGGEINLIGMSNGKTGTASAYLDGNFDKLKSLSWRLQGTVKQGGNVSAPKYILVNTGLKEYNFSYTLKWEKKKYGIELFYSQFNTTLGIFAASHIGNLTDLKKAFNSSTPLETGEFTYKIGRPFQHVEHELVKFKTYCKIGTKGKLSMVYARQYNLRFEYDKHFPLNDSLKSLNQPELKFQLTTHSTDLLYEHNPIKNWTGCAGISGMKQGNSYSGRALIPNFRSYNGGIFLIERWRRNKFEIEGGIRYDLKWLQVFKYEYVGSGIYELTKPIHQFSNLTGNIGAIFKKDSILNLSVNVGTAWRAPSVNELYSFGLHHGAAAVEFGNNKLLIEKVYSTIITMRYTPNSKLFIEISPYYNYIHGFIYRQAALSPILTIHGAFPSFYFEQTNATISGSDFYIKYNIWKIFEVSGKGSLIRAKNKIENNWLVLMPSDRFETELTYRMKKYKKINSTYFSTSFQYIGKQWRVPVNSDFVAPPNAYYLINFHASFSVQLKQQNIEFGLSVYNLLDTSYRDYLDRFRYFTDAIGRNVSVRIKVPINIDFKTKK